MSKRLYVAIMATGHSSNGYVDDYVADPSWMWSLIDKQQKPYPKTNRFTAEELADILSYDESIERRLTAMPLGDILYVNSIVAKGSNNPAIYKMVGDYTIHSSNEQDIYNRALEYYLRNTFDEGINRHYSSGSVSLSSLNTMEHMAVCVQFRADDIIKKNPDAIIIDGMVQSLAHQVWLDFNDD